MNEIWIEIPDTDGRYSVSSLGNVRSNWSDIPQRNLTHRKRIEKQKLLKPWVHTTGYWRVGLGRNNQKYVHRLIAAAFVPNPDLLPQVDHIDGNRLNYGVIGRASLGAVELHATHLRYADPLERFGPEPRGFGTSADVSVAASPKLRLEANYWQARNFRAPLGQGLFQSRNPEDPDAWFREQPQLLGLGLAWEGASSLRIRAWYDVVDRSVQPSVTWVRYLVLDPVSGTRHRKGQAPQ
jgi:hypothetical protein